MLMMGVVLLVIYPPAPARNVTAPLRARRGLSSMMYLVFGAWALGASGGDLFFLVFLIPGAFLAMASLYRTQPSN